MIVATLPDRSILLTVCHRLPAVLAVQWPAPAGLSSVYIKLLWCGEQTAVITAASHTCSPASSQQSTQSTVTMSWTLDTSGLLASEGSLVTLQGQTKGDTKANAMWVETEAETQSGCWRFDVKAGSGMWVGVAAEDKFGPSYSLKGLMFGGPGNLSDGGSLVTSGWGPKLAAGHTLDMRLRLEGGSLTLEFCHNNNYLGPAFHIEGWSWGVPRPVVSLSGAGSSVGVARLGADQFSETKAVPSSSSVEGSWACASPRYSLHLGKGEAGGMVQLGVHVGNTMSFPIIRDADSGACTVKGPVCWTQVGLSGKFLGEIASQLCCCAMPCHYVDNFRAGAGRVLAVWPAGQHQQAGRRPGGHLHQRGPAQPPTSAQARASLQTRGQLDEVRSAHVNTLSNVLYGRQIKSPM